MYTILEASGTELKVGDQIILPISCGWDPKSLAKGTISEMKIDEHDTALIKVIIFVRLDDYFYETYGKKRQPIRLEIPFFKKDLGGSTTLYVRRVMK